MKRLLALAWLGLGLHGETPPEVFARPEGGLLVAAFRDAGVPHLGAFLLRNGPPRPIWDVPGVAVGPPVLIGAPNAVGPWSATAPGYGAFVWRERERRAVVWAAKGDGALGAFDAANGASLQSIPLGVSGALSFDDAFVDAPWASGGSRCPPGIRGRSCQWRTLLAARTDDGGLVVLDVTRPDSGRSRSATPDCRVRPERRPPPGCSAAWPSVVFRRLPADGSMLTLPAFGRVKMPSGENRAVAVVGTADSRRRAGSVLILDAATGETLRVVGLPHGERRAPGEVPAVPAAVDRDGDGFLDLLVFGDREGALWTADLAGDGGSEPIVASLSLEPAGPGSPGPIEQTPAVARSEGSLYATFVTAPPGSEVVSIPLDGVSRSRRALASIDSPSAPLLGGCAGSAPARREGWAFRLESGDRVVGRPLVVSGYAYVAASGVEPKATGRLYRLAVVNGDPCLGAGCCGGGDWTSVRVVDLAGTATAAAPVVGLDEGGTLGVWTLVPANGRPSLVAFPFPLRVALRKRALR